jgi:hypothetical protein
MSELPGTLPISKFYTCQEHVIDRFKRCGRQMGYSPMSAAETLEWQKKLRAKVSELLGLGEMEPCEPVVNITERTQMDGYVRERIELQTEPDVWTIFYALIPDGIQPGEKRPLVLAPHGHDSGGKFATAGRTDIPS